MTHVIATIALMLAVGVLEGCAAPSPSQANETPGPAFQSPYCSSHANEPRCMN
jgi:hypothetical protein